MSDSPLQKPMQNPDVVVREEDKDGALLFNPDTNQIRVINGVGLFLWKLFDGSRDMDGLIMEVKNAYDEVPEETILSDINDYLEDMSGSGFVISGKEKTGKS